FGVWGPLRGPQQATRTRGAPRLCRGAPNVWGFGGHFGAPSRRREPEERHGYAGARRTFGGLGAISGPPAGDANQRSATAMPGRAERLGVWGPFRGPQQATRTRGAPRLCRGAPNVWGLGAISGPPAGDANQRSATAMPGRAERLGFGGHFGAPSRRREPEERHGYAGARRTFGGLGAISWPPAGDANQRSATAMPGRAERLGGWGPFRGPHP